MQINPYIWVVNPKYRLWNEISPKQHIRDLGIQAFRTHLCSLFAMVVCINNPMTSMEESLGVNICQNLFWYDIILDSMYCWRGCNCPIRIPPNSCHCGGDRSSSGYCHRHHCILCHEEKTKCRVSRNESVASSTIK